MTESGGIDRLRANPDRFVQQRGEQMEDNVQRLERLRDTQARLRMDGPLGRIATLATHYDSRIATGTFNDFMPAVPVSPEAFVLGLIGFIFGGGVVHLTGHQMKRSVRRSRRSKRPQLD